MAGSDSESDPDAPRELRVLTGPNLYFPRPAVKLTLDASGVLAADPAAFAGYHDWEVYYRTTAGDVLLPIGYARTSTIPVAEYLAAHPQ